MNKRNNFQNLQNRLKSIFSEVISKSIEIKILSVIWKNALKSMEIARLNVASKIYENRFSRCDFKIPAQMKRRRQKLVEWRADNIESVKRHYTRRCVILLAKMHLKHRKTLQNMKIIFARAQYELYLQIYLAEKATNGQFRGNMPEKLKLISQNRYKRKFKLSKLDSSIL